MGGARPVAKGVWLVAGGLPPTMNVYLIEDDGGGVTMFDAGVASMAKKLRTITSEIGGLNRIVLGHGHPDHRGAASKLDAPVYCHPDNVADTEGDGGRHYMPMHKLPPHARIAFPALFKMWDGGPVPVTGTIDEGDDVSGFKAVAIPGHAPGQIALYRESDGLLLSSDLFYTLNPFTGLKASPRLPHRGFNQDEDLLRASVRKAAALDPRAIWPGHADPVTEDARSTLASLAETPIDA